VLAVCDADFELIANVATLQVAKPLQRRTYLATKRIRKRRVRRVALLNGVRSLPGLPPFVSAIHYQHDANQMVAVPLPFPIRSV
jgi:hypothetical protein